MSGEPESTGRNRFGVYTRISMATVLCLLLGRAGRADDGTPTRPFVKRAAKHDPETALICNGNTKRVTRQV